jgi:soluble cytochrome b562
MNSFPTFVFTHLNLTVRSPGGVLGDRFFSKPPPFKRYKIMTFLKISIPVYKKSSWDTLEKDGKIEVSSDVDNLSEGYQLLKIEIDKLLFELDAQNRLVKDAKALEHEIQEKSRLLQNLVKNIDKATAHYEDLKFFLQNLGVDPLARRLTFDKQLLLQDASLSEVEVVSQLPEF